MSISASTGIDNAGIKIASAWGSVLLVKFGFSSWSEVADVASAIAATFAAIYSLCLLTEWWWKKFWRPLFVRFGWVKPNRSRRESDRS